MDIMHIILIIALVLTVGLSAWLHDGRMVAREMLRSANERLEKRDQRIDDTFRDWRAAEEAWGAELTRLREEHGAWAAKQKAYQQKQLDALLLFMELHPDLAANFGRHYGIESPPELRSQPYNVDHEKVANYLYQQEQSDRFSEYVTAKRDALRGPKEESDGR